VLESTFYTLQLTGRPTTLRLTFLAHPDRELGDAHAKDPLASRLLQLAAEVLT